LKLIKAAKARMYRTLVAPELFEMIGSLSPAEKQQFADDISGGPIAAKLRAFNRGELPEAEMAEIRARLKKSSEN
jgi:hypothetical protein